MNKNIVTVDIPSKITGESLPYRLYEINTVYKNNPEAQRIVKKLEKYGHDYQDNPSSAPVCAEHEIIMSILSTYPNYRQDGDMAIRVLTRYGRKSKRVNNDREPNYDHIYTIFDNYTSYGLDKLTLSGNYNVFRTLFDNIYDTNFLEEVMELKTRLPNVFSNFRVSDYRGPETFFSLDTNVFNVIKLVLAHRGELEDPNIRIADLDDSYYENYSEYHNELFNILKLGSFAGVLARRMSFLHETELVNNVISRYGRDSVSFLKYFVELCVMTHYNDNLINHYNDFCETYDSLMTLFDGQNVLSEENNKKRTEFVNSVIHSEKPYSALAYSVGFLFPIDLIDKFSHDAELFERVVDAVGSLIQRTLFRFPENLYHGIIIMEIIYRKSNNDIIEFIENMSRFFNVMRKTIRVVFSDAINYMSFINANTKTLDDDTIISLMGIENDYNTYPKESDRLYYRGCILQPPYDKSPNVINDNRAISFLPGDVISEFKTVGYGGRLDTVETVVESYFRELTYS